MRQSVLIIVCLFAALPGLAADGATPIATSTVIWDPGRYVVTRDISMAGTAIHVNANDVTLDLNGFTVESTAAVAIFCFSPCANVEIRGGTIRTGASHAIYILDASHVTISDSRIESPLVGIFINDGTHVTISGNQIDADDGVYFQDGNSVTISHNHLSTSGRGLYLWRGRGHLVHRNVIQFDGSADYGIQLFDIWNIEISENIITSDETILDPAFGIYAGDSATCLIRDNRIEVKGTGIDVGYQSLVRNNAVAGRGGASTWGIAVRGSYNHIEGNLITGSDYGLYLYGGFNIYRRNTAQNNTTSGFVDGGVSNTSHGDNYMPTPM